MLTLMRLAAIILFIGVPFQARSQDFTYKQFTASDGLPSNAVYRSFQDAQGYIWFCTNAGVSRFNGISFQNFTVKEGLSDNEVFGAFQTRLGRIWFKTFNGKLCYYEKGAFHNEKTDPWLAGVSIWIWYVFQDEHDNCWISSTTEDYVIILNEARQSIKKIPKVFKDSIIIVSDLGVDTISIVEYNRLGTALYKFTQSKKITAFINHTQDVQTYLSFIKRYLRSLTKQFPSIPLHHLYNFFIAGQPISALMLLEYSFSNENKFWFRFVAKGAFSSGSLYDPDEKLTGYLLQKNISSALYDREGNYWFTSFGEGVFLLNNPGIKSFEAVEGKAEIHSITANPEYIICGMVNRVLFINRKTGKKSVWMYGFSKDSAEYNRVKDLELDNRGYLWIATDRGAGCLDFKKNKLYPIYMKGLYTEQQLFSAMKCLSPASNGDIYLGSFNQLYRGNSTHYIDILCKKRITAVEELATDSLLVGSTDGLHIYRNGQLSKFKIGNETLNGSITDIKKVKNDFVGIATTDAGFFILKNNRLFSINSSDSIEANKRLSSDICRKIFVDASGEIWVCTNKGLCRVSVQSWKPFEYALQKFTTEDGLVSNDVNDVYIENDTVWVATTGGLSFFPKNHVRRNGSLPLIYISNFDSLNKRSFKYRDKITIAFEGISYESIGQTRYLYKLTGLDEDWQITTRNEVFYEVLPPGNYKLEVYSINRFGQRSTRPATANFTILPPWWRTTWTILFYIIGAGTILFSATYIARRNSRNKERARMKHINELQQLELKALRSQMNPHFIFNTLNAIQKYILENDAEASYRYLTRFAKLIRNFLENSRHTTINLHQELDLLRSYVEMEGLRFRNKFNFSIEIDPTLDLSAIFIPSMLIQPYVENAIWHGIQHKKDGGYVKISIWNHSPGILKCCIEDNGIGRRQAKEIQLLSSSQHNSVGMTITQQRLELVNQRLKDAVNVNFIDIADQSAGKDSGTIVELIISYSNKPHETESSNY